MHKLKHIKSRTTIQENFYKLSSGRSLFQFFFLFSSHGTYGNEFQWTQFLFSDSLFSNKFSLFVVIR